MRYENKCVAEVCELSSIISLVEACDCTDIDYTFSEIPFERPTQEGLR